ncbi:hypothetical protein ANCDUO_22541 [Ancylostoma duodenale]|uniref:Uncharacterized protein n=1 Tax=Ancylostoma duodenale TaxID=51022 RepID=A0A0C2FKX7_9BILA|nr:hypothetical protein ANCDUO_22541 [Ancylostoma duodenale]
MRVSGFLVFIACIIAWAFAAPVSDTEAAYRICKYKRSLILLDYPLDWMKTLLLVNKYLQRFGGDDLQDVYLVGDHGNPNFCYFLNFSWTKNQAFSFASTFA